MLTLQGGPKSEATTFEGSHLQNVLTNLREVWLISAMFCSEHICYLYIKQIYNTVAPPGDKINNQDLLSKSSETYAF